MESQAHGFYPKRIALDLMCSSRHRTQHQIGIVFLNSPATSAMRLPLPAPCQGPPLPWPRLPLEEAFEEVFARSMRSGGLFEPGSVQELQQSPSLLTGLGDKKGMVSTELSAALSCTGEDSTRSQMQVPCSRGFSRRRQNKYDISVCKHFRRF